MLSEWYYSGVTLTPVEQAFKHEYDSAYEEAEKRRQKQPAMI